MAAELHDEKGIFFRAIDIVSAADRASYLDAACGEDHPLRARVDALLRQHERPQYLLDAAKTAKYFDDAATADPAGTVIGPYSLLEQIGEGGFGVVYMAEQTEPVKRRVALKIIKPGMDTKEVIARFEAERQALALMDHPNIAKVLDAGTTEGGARSQEPGVGERHSHAALPPESYLLAPAAGRPYFVMELVRGVPLTDYCDQCSLTTRERLELFVPVCQAIQHAHQKGVIHRDIKPSNVLIAMQDGKPVPKVIDFGVAKAINQRLTEQSVVTGFAQLIGTPLYMSPEQAELSPLDVDTRSDVYSLGVLLYELLTGTTPFERERFKEATFDELRRIIREEEPARPSARISTLGAALTTIAEHRRTEPRKLQQLVKGDLDWIVMKSLEKDRTRRYETVAALAADVQRHLADEPIEARPPSFAYRMTKFLRRNRAAVTAALVILAGTTIATSQGIVAHRRGREKETELLARIDAERRAEIAEQERFAAEERQRQAELDALVAEALQLASGSQPDYETAVANLTEVLNSRPADAEVYLYRGSIYYRWRKPLRALRDLERALELRPEGNLAAHQLLAIVTQQLGRNEDSAEHLKLAQAAEPDSVEALVTQALALNDRQGIELLTRAIEQQPFNPILYRHRGRLAKSLLSQGKPTTEVVQLGISDLEKVLKAFPDDAPAHCWLGQMYQAEHRCEAAEACFLRAIELQENFSLPYASLGYLYREQNRLEEAEASYRKAIELDPRNGAAHNNLGTVYASQNRVEEAEQAYLKAIELTPNPALAWSNLGNLYRNQNRLEEAEEALLKAVELDPELAPAWDNLGLLHKELHRLDEAEETLLKAIELDPELAVAWSNLGLVYQAQNRPDEAEQSCLRAVELKPQEAGPYNKLGNVYHAQNRLDEAEECYLKAIEFDPHDAAAWNNLGLVYAKQQRLEDAEKAYRKTIELDPDEAAAYHNLGDLYRKQKRLDKAEECYLKAVELDPHYADTWVALGLLYSDQQRLDKAEECYLKAIELDPDDGKAYVNVGIVYRAQNRLDEAEQSYLRAIELDPRNSQRYFDLGLLHYDQNRLDEAEKSYLKAIELDPDDARPWNNLGNVYDAQHRPDEAEKSYLKAIALDPELAEAWNNLGGLYLAQNRLDEAEESYLRAIKLNPGFAIAFRNLGLVYQDQNRLDQAEEVYLRAIELDPDNAGAWNNLGSVYLSQNRLDKALEHLLKASELDPDEAVTHINLAGVYTALQRPEKAEASYLRAIELDPDDARWWDRLGTLYAAQQRLEKAEEAYLKASELDRDYALAWRNLGILYTAQNRLGEAEECWRKVIELTPDEPEPLNTLAWLLATAPAGELRDPPRAVELARRAVEAAPENGGYHNTLGVALYRAGDFAGAIEALQKSEELKPDGAVAFNGFFLAMAHWQLEHQDEARQWFERSVAWMDEHRPKNEELLRFRAEAGELLGIDTEENRGQKTEVRGRNPDM